MHQGRAGDESIQVFSLSVFFEASPGVPLTDQEANGGIDRMSLYLDDGSGTFEPGADTMVTSISTIVLTDGVATMTQSLGGTPMLLAPETSTTYFLTATLQSSIPSSDPILVPCWKIRNS